MTDLELETALRERFARPSAQMAVFAVGTAVHENCLLEVSHYSRVNLGVAQPHQVLSCLAAFMAGANKFAALALRKYCEDNRLDFAAYTGQLNEFIGTMMLETGLISGGSMEIDGASSGEHAP